MNNNVTSNRPPDLDRDLGFLLNDVARLMRRAFDRRVRQLGLTRAQWFVLAHLYRTDGQTQTDLAEELDMERAPLGKLLDRLEDGGWIERRPDPNDRRANRVFKTAKIDPLIEEMRKEAEGLYDVALKGLDDAARQRFVELLTQVKGNLLSAIAEADLSDISAYGTD